MALAEHERKGLDRFKSEIGPLMAGYADISFSFIAIKSGDKFKLVRGSVFLNTLPPQMPLTSFQSENVLAGHFLLTATGQAFDEFLENIFTGTIKTPYGEVSFEPEEGRLHGAYYSPFHTAGLQQSNRLSVLSIHGGPAKSLFDSLEIDWEVRAASIPYDGLADLTNEFRLGVIADIATVEVIAYTSLVISGDAKVSGTTATVGMVATKGLAADKIQLGYRIFSKGQVVERGALSGTKLSWIEREGLMRGTAEIAVPEGAVAHCFASYAGIALNHGWATDPQTAQNPRRVAYEALDPGLELLREIIEVNPEQTGHDQRDLEAGVSWLLWMLGFSITNPGGTKRSANSTDLLANTPRNNVVVVECTIGNIKADKISMLVERTEKIRQKLYNSGNRHLHVLPVMVTSKLREEVKAALELALRSNVLVLTREDLLEAMGRTYVLQEPDELFKEAIRSLSEPTQGVLQLSDQPQADRWKS